MLEVTRFFEKYNLQNSTPDLLFLRELAKAFSHLPYENVTKILKSASDSQALDKLRQTEEVLSDHLRWNTGGTCFSLCNALQDILQQCRYQSFIAMADMHYGANIHCAIIAPTESGPYLLDPGYLLHDPIPLPSVQSTHQTPMNTVVIKNEGNQNYSLFTQESGIQRWRYRLRARPTPREQFLQHWIHSFSLNSMENVTLTRVNENGRLYYRKDRIELVHPAKRTTQKTTVAETDLLANLFGLPVDLILKAQQAVSR
jgi:arylamine N-acetyltransferase